LLNVLCENSHSMNGCLPAFSGFHPAGGAYAAGRTRMSCLQKGRKALGAVGGFFIGVLCFLHGTSIVFFAVLSHTTALNKVESS